MAWIRPEKQVDNVPFVFSATTWRAGWMGNFQASSEAGMMRSYLSASSEFSLWLNAYNNGDSAKMTYSTAPMDNHEWKHVALILNEGYYRYYENGVQKALVARTSTDARWTDEWYVGYDNDYPTAQYFGSMYDFYVNPSVALTQSQLDAYITASAPQESLPALPSSFASLPTGLFRLAYDASTSSFVNYGRHEGSVGITAHDTSPGLLAGPVDGSFRYTVREEVKLPRFTLDYQTEFTLMAWIRPEKLSSAPFVHSASEWVYQQGGLMHSYLNSIDGEGNVKGFQHWLTSENNGAASLFSNVRVNPDNHEWKHVALILNGGYYRYYENGVQKALVARGTSDARHTDEWYVGYWGTGWTAQYFGSMYDFYVNPSVALTQSQLDAYVAASAPQESLPALPSSFAPLPTGLFRLAYDTSTSSFVNHGRHGGSVGITAHDASPGLLAGPVDGSFRYTVREEVKLPRFTLDYQTEFTIMAWIRPEKQATYSAPFVHSASAWIQNYVGQMHSHTCNPSTSMARQRGSNFGSTLRMQAQPQGCKFPMWS